MLKKCRNKIFAESDDFYKALKLLEEYGYVALDERETGNHKSAVYVYVNPKVFEKPSDDRWLCQQKALGRAPVYVIDLFKGCHIYYGVTIGIACCKSVLRTVVAAILRLFGNASFEKGGMEE